MKIDINNLDWENLEEFPKQEKIKKKLKVIKKEKEVSKKEEIDTYIEPTEEEK